MDVQQPPPKAVIRRPLATEARSLAALFAASWEAGYRGLMPDALLDRRSTVEGVLERRNAKRKTPPGRLDWVMEWEGNLVASSSSGPVRDEDPEEGLAEIYSFYVDPAFWRRGFGRTLVRHVCRELAERGFDHVVLHCLTDNARARRFYESMGFRVEIERFPKAVEEFQLDHTRYRMALSLTGEDHSPSLPDA